MSNIGAVLKAEIVRLARRVSRGELATTHRMVVSHRRQIAALRRQVSELERQLGLVRKVSRPTAVAAPVNDKVRFTAKGLVSLRKRLGLNAAEFGKLVDASGASVYNWENRKAKPRKAQVAAIAALRGLGKREALARLEMMKQ